MTLRTMPVTVFAELEYSTFFPSRCPAVLCGTAGSPLLRQYLHQGVNLLCPVGRRQLGWGMRGDHEMVFKGIRDGTHGKMSQRRHRVQMGDGGEENVPGSGVRQELLQEALLGPAAGKLGYTVFKAGDNKAGGFAHAGEMAVCPGLCPPGCPGHSLPGDDAVNHINGQLMGWVTTDRESPSKQSGCARRFQGGAADEGLTVFKSVSMSRPSGPRWS